MKFRTFEELVVTDFCDDFSDPEFALGYLQICLEKAQAHDDIGIFLLALRDVTRAREAVAGVTAQTGQTPSSFDKLLANSRNLDFTTIARTLPALGFKFQLVATDAKLTGKPAPKRHRTTKREQVAA